MVKKLQNLLDNKQNVVIALYGAWGVGKTYFWKEVFCKKDCYKDKNIYISLIGKSDITAIKKELTLKLINKSKLSKFWLKSQIKSISLNICGFSVNVGIENLFDLKDKFDDKIICFDDLERMDKAILRGVLGLINELKEHKNAKIVLIFNKEKVDSENFFEKDKIIDSELFYNPSVEDSFKIAAKNVPLQDNVKDFIKRYCKDKNIVNIRVIKRILSDFVRFAEEFKCDFNRENARQILETLVRFSAINAEKMGIDLVKMLDYYNKKATNKLSSYGDVFDEKEFAESGIDIKTFEKYMNYLKKSKPTSPLVDSTFAEIIAKFISNDTLNEYEKNEIYLALR